MSLKQQLTIQLSEVTKELGLDVVPGVDYPVDTAHGDYATNIALVAAKKAGKNPRELAEEIIKELGIKNQKSGIFEKIEIAGPGFINFWVKPEKLIKATDSLRDNEVKIDIDKIDQNGKKILVEYAHPNTHKAFHIGHLRNITTGESLIRLLEASGVNVIRANYQGDVGMHIAKALYGLTMLIGDGEIDLKDLEYEDSSNEIERVLNIVKALETRSIKERMDLIGKAYAYGSKLFEEKGVEMAAIKQINSSIYSHEWGTYKPYEEVYRITRQWSLDYFQQIYQRVYTHFDRLYFESEVFKSGKENVLEGLKQGIFQESDGAIIFPGSMYGLHDRVFISSEGNPTYEGKDMGLAPLQHKEYHPDLIIHVLGPEQYGYTRVIFKALDLLFPKDAGKQLHLVYGWVKLKHGKMSSRTGNVILGEWLLDEAKKKIQESYESSDEIAEQVAVGAVKYSFLKVGLNQEIAFDLEESISLQGNSGPYLQYTYARTQSVLRKSQKSSSHQVIKLIETQSEERDVLRLLSRFPEVVEEAALRYAPHVLCTYLFDLAQAYNLFYQKFQILKETGETREFRLLLTSATGIVLKKGLYLLGIKTPERM
jgi:arginyl-tRNA synthetase